MNRRTVPPERYKVNPRIVNMAVRQMRQLVQEASKSMRSTNQRKAPKHEHGS